MLVILNGTLTVIKVVISSDAYSESKLAGVIVKSTHTEVNNPLYTKRVYQQKMFSTGYQRANLTIFFPRQAWYLTEAMKGIASLPPGPNFIELLSTKICLAALWNWALVIALVPLKCYSRNYNFIMVPFTTEQMPWCP